MTFNLDNLITDCRALLKERAAASAVNEVVARAVAEPAQVLKALGEPAKGEVQRLHVADDLTILNVIWTPRMTIMPHNHNMWAVIGVYGGREDNIFWRRVKDAENGLIEAAGAKSMGPRDSRPLGDNIIHSVTNPTTRLTGAIHVYGGDFFAQERSEWDALDLHEHPYDIDKNMQLFVEGNAALEQS